MFSQNKKTILKSFFQGLAKRKTTALLAIFALVAMPFFSGCGSSGQNPSYTVNLEIWGPFDDSMIYAEMISQYKKINPYVGEIKYKKLSQDTYKQELLDALASGQGPDIFLINNAWLPSFENKLEPAPTALISDQDMKANFPDVVSADFMDTAKTYAVPLSVDSLALYYNRDMFNAVGITAPPKTWQEFDQDVAKLTRLGTNGNFVVSGAAMGTSININRAPDLLSLLLLQSGAELPTKKGMLAKIDQGVVTPSGEVAQAGEQALGYYTKFSKLATDSNLPNPVYTWNIRNHNSVDAFAEGSVAMMLNYSWQLPAIKNKNPKLNFAVAPVPQAYTTNPTSYANYWGYAVARNKVAAAATDTNANDVPVAAVPNAVRTHEAWQFLKFMALKNSGTIRLYNAVSKNSADFPINYDPAIDYLKKTMEPAARRDIIDLQKVDSNLGPFATGNLIAKSWYQMDPDAIDKIFNDAIDSVDNGDMTLHNALSLMTNRINYLTGGSSLR